MKTPLLLLYALLLAACTGQAAEPQKSPSAEFTVRTEISGDEAGPTRRLCVKLVVLDVATHREMIFQTGASNTQKWALVWSPTNSMVLYSSDSGTSAYDIKAGKIIERPANPEEQEIGREAYETKYGKKPKASLL